MGVLKKFEQRLEGLVNGTFAKVFKSEVQPVEIAGALQRECDNNATIWNRDRTVVPNDFIVELSAPATSSVATAHAIRPWAVSRKNTSSVCTPTHFVRSRPVT